MLAIDVTIESELVTKRGHKQIMRKLIRQSLTRVRQNLPRHFERNSKTTPGGAYGYEKRKRDYQMRKAKVKGHQKPLVFTGKLKTAIQSNVKITATSTRGRLKTRGYFPMTAQRRNEIEAISMDEIQDLRARMVRDYRVLADRSEFKRKRKRKSKRK